MWEWVVRERGEGEEDENSEEEGEEEEEYPVQKEGWRIVFRLHEESVLSGIGALSLWVRVRAVRRRYEVNVICAGVDAVRGGRGRRSALAVVGAVGACQRGVPRGGRGVYV